MKGGNFHHHPHHHHRHLTIPTMGVMILPLQLVVVVVLLLPMPLHPNQLHPLQSHHHNTKQQQHHRHLHPQLPRENATHISSTTSATATTPPYPPHPPTHPFSSLNARTTPHPFVKNSSKSSLRNWASPRLFLHGMLYVPVMPWGGVRGQWWI